MYYVWIGRIFIQVVKFYVVNKTTGLEYIKYYQGKIIFTYENDNVILDYEFGSMYDDLTSTQSIGKDKGIICYRDILLYYMISYNIGEYELRINDSIYNISSRMRTTSRLNQRIP